MLIPGINNLLNLANRVIIAQPFTYFAFTGRTTLANGNDVASYAPPINLTGNPQPIPRQLFAQMGLDLQSYYINFFVSRDILDITRDVSGDYIGWAGRKFQCLSKTPWFQQDGWDQVLCVEVNQWPAGFGFDAAHQNFDNGNFAG